MTFLLNWLLFYACIISAMCIDNLFWISASPEYKKFKKLPLILWDMGNILFIGEECYLNKIDYIIRYRIYTVLTHWRDIIPALIVSMILALLW